MSFTLHCKVCFGKTRANKKTVCVVCKTVPLGSSGRLPPDNPLLDVITSDPEQHANSLSAQYLLSRLKLMFASSGTPQGLEHQIVPVEHQSTSHCGEFTSTHM